MDGQPTWTDCDEAGDYVVPNVLSPRDLVSRPHIMDETVPHIISPSSIHSIHVSISLIKAVWQLSFMQTFILIQISH